MKTLKVLNVISFIFVMLVVLICIYGFATDCPNTAGYVYCGSADEWSLQFWNNSADPADTGKNLQH